MQKKVDKLIGRRVVVKKCEANWHGKDNKECLCSLIGKSVIIERKEDYPICRTSIYFYYLKGSDKRLTREDIYLPMEKKDDFLCLLKKIDLELDYFVKEIKDINVSVQRDLQLLVEKYLKHEKIDNEKVEQEYFDILKRKKLDAVLRAVDKLQSLKEDIMAVVAE